MRALSKQILLETEDAILNKVRHAKALGNKQLTEFLRIESDKDPKVGREIERRLLEEEFGEKSTPSAFTINPVNETKFRHLNLFTQKPQVVFQKHEQIGDFRIERVLGHGSFGIVYLAQQESLGRSVALKVSPNCGNEAKTLAKLEHESIVKIFGEIQDTERDIRLIAMQNIPGTTLGRALNYLKHCTPEKLNGRTFINSIDKLSTDTSALNDPNGFETRKELRRLDYTTFCLHTVKQIASALDYAHQRGVLHLDIKPGNILMNRYGRPCLTDFNVSINQKENPKHLPLGGTEAYMAPEQKAILSGQQNQCIDHRADIYSLGRILEEMLAASKQRFPLIERIIDKCLMRNPRHRYQSMKALSKSLHQAIELRNTLNALGNPGRWILSIYRYPFALLTACLVVPQFFSGYFGYEYYRLRITEALTMNQRDLIDLFLYIYIPSVYFCGIGIWAYFLRPLVQFSRDPAPFFRDSDRLKRIRKHTLSLPKKIIGLILMGWVPASILFPAIASVQEQELNFFLFGHFLFSFAISSLVSLSYAYLYSQFIVLRILYPKMIRGLRFGGRRSNPELKSIVPTLKEFQRLPGVVPLVGVTVIALQGPTQQEAFIPLIVFLNAMGIIGIFLSSHITHLIQRTLRIFLDKKAE